jgi:hypothetical protein
VGQQHGRILLAQPPYDGKPCASLYRFTAAHGRTHHFGIRRAGADRSRKASLDRLPPDIGLTEGAQEGIA